ncbi:MAG: hypothetical protein CL916_05400 [Deltaproteobacteria bacterium]|nr:hypothetical protein [Deltaproteobacteria bacterium]
MDTLFLRNESSMHAWWKESIFYQIYPRSFYDSNNDGIGDLEGIIQKLDHLKSLGIDCIWLSPIFPSPHHDFGYDIAEYCAVDPIFGSLDIMDNLIEQASIRNIKIILDGVFNHTSIEHPWFLDSCRNGEKKDWYIWNEKANNWTSVFGGSAWTWHPIRKAHYLHSFAKEQPDINWSHPEVQKEILKIMEFWYKRGISGFRLDVFNCYAKDTQHTDNPKRKDILGLIGGFAYSFINQHHVYDRDRPELFPILRDMRKLADQYNAVLIGETLDENLRYNRASEYVGPELLHLTFHFQLLHTKWNPKKIKDSCMQLQKDFQSQCPTIVTSNHDFPRQSKRWGADERKRRIMALLTLTLRGVPFIYYGEEIGLPHISIPRASIQDPVGKKFWPFFSGRDGSRTPMQWSNDKFCGFSKTKPWLPTESKNLCTVHVQEEDPSSILHLYRALITLRKSHPVLHKGALKWLSSSKESLCYERYLEQERIVICINLSSRTITTPVQSGTIIFRIGSADLQTLQPYTAILIS